MKEILSGPFYLDRSIWEALIQTSGGRLNGYAQITIINRLIEQIYQVKLRGAGSLK